MKKYTGYYQLDNQCEYWNVSMEYIHCLNHNCVRKKDHVFSHYFDNRCKEVRGSSRISSLEPRN